LELTTPDRQCTVLWLLRSGNSNDPSSQKEHFMKTLGTVTGSTKGTPIKDRADPGKPTLRM
jgi:hypothetical protein